MNKSPLVNTLASCLSQDQDVLKTFPSQTFQESFGRRINRTRTEFVTMSARRVSRLKIRRFSFQFLTRLARRTNQRRSDCEKEGLVTYGEGQSVVGGARVFSHHSAFVLALRLLLPGRRRRLGTTGENRFQELMCATHARIEGIPQTIAKKVECKYRERERHGWRH